MLLLMKKKASKNVFYLCMLSMLCSHLLHEEIWRKKSACILPFDSTNPALNFFSPCWMLPGGDRKFEFRYRFRREHFGELLTQFNFF